VKTSLTFLAADCDRVALSSRSTGKVFVSYARKASPQAISRPTNTNLFEPNAEWVEENWIAAEQGRLEPSAAAKLYYSMATAYSVASDLFDRNNKKGPATYFECLIGHLFSRHIGVNPSRRITLQAGNSTIPLTMDFLFDLGGHTPRIHLPVKLSSRERVVQAWAH